MSKCKRYILNWLTLTKKGENINKYFNTVITENTGTNKDISTLVLIQIPDLVLSDNVTSLESAFVFSKLDKMPKMNTENVTNMALMFSSSNIKEFPTFDTSNVKNMLSMFNNNKEIITAPVMNTKKVTDMSYMFYGCSKLENIPLYDTSSVHSLTNIFNNCLRLSNESLDNILQMCINAISYTGAKRLNVLGINGAFFNYTNIVNLSHYQDFINAGWTLS